MKTKTFILAFTQLSKCLIVFLFSIQALSTHAQIFPKLSFKGGTIFSGTPLQQGSVYKFPNVTIGVDAFVTIQSLSGGATVASIDQFGGVGYDDAFQPIVNPAAGVPNSYARFKIAFKTTIIGTTYTFANLAVTGLDIDGTGLNLLEFCTIDMNGGIAIYQSTTPEISIAQIGTSYKASNISGNNISGIDSTQKQVMFTVRNGSVSSLTIDFGAVTTTSGNRNFSAFFGDFQYPSGIVLPVVLSSFNASVEQNKVGLNWVTEQELNSSHFEVERSLDGKEYQQIALVFAAGSSDSKLNYYYADNLTKTTNGVIYYRLKMVDIDGSYNYSNIRMVRIGKQNEKLITINTFPNPVTSELHITIPDTWQNKMVSYELFNCNGQRVITNKATSASQNETINVSKLAPGFYVVKVNCSNEMIQQKIIKQ